MHTFTYTDGHHKLIRWRLVTHCAIDGYSRLIVYCRCSSNNRASTVYDLFLDAVEKYGLPSRIRCDQGRENIHSARHMLRHRGEQRRSVLVGSSVHNQRIERLWRDMHRCATSLFYRLFYYLEENDHLNPVSTTQVFALHYVYKPRINQALKQFVAAWNYHSIRTEHGQTPNQLFTSGSLHLRNAGLAALDFFENVTDTYGVDGSGLGESIVSDEDDDEGVEVPSTNLGLTDEQIAELQSVVDPLSESSEFGVDLYFRALDLIISFISDQ